MKNLLPHRIHWPSRILLQTLCVANRFLHLLMLSEKGRYEGALSGRRLAVDEDNIRWYCIERDEEEVGLAMDKSWRSYTFMSRVWTLSLNT